MEEDTGVKTKTSYNKWLEIQPKPKQSPIKISPEVKTTLRTFLETTSVKGVSKVAKNTSLVLRVLWAIAVVTGLAVAVWQITSLLLRYFAHGTITNLNICNDCRAPFPDLTICNLNPLSAVADFGLTPFKTYLTDFNALAESIQRNATLYEQMQITTGMRTDEEIFKLYEEMFSITGYFQNINQTTLSRAMQIFGMNILVHDCNWYDWDHKAYLKENCRRESVYLNYNPELLMCFTIHLNESIPGVSREDVAGLNTILYVNDFPNDTMPKYAQNIHSSQSKGIRILVHARDTYPDISKGFDVSPGNDITITIEAQQWSRLGEPYSKCSNRKFLEDYVNTGSSQSIRYKYTDTSAHFRCRQENNLQRCGCFDPHLPITPGLFRKYHNLPACGKLPENHPLVNDVMQTAVNVACYFKGTYGSNDSSSGDACQFDQPCNEYRYTLASSISAWPHETYALPFYTDVIRTRDERQAKFGDKFDVYGTIYSLMGTDPESAFDQLRSQDLIRRNFIQLKLRFQSEGLKVYKDVPSVTLDSFFGTMGGVLNLWIGVTFFTIIELLDLFYKLCGLLLKNKTKNSKTKVNSVDSF